MQMRIRAQAVEVIKGVLGVYDLNCKWMFTCGQQAYADYLQARPRWHSLPGTLHGTFLRGTSHGSSQAPASAVSPGGCWC